MHTVQKTDWFAQVVISTASVLSIPMLFLYGFGAGLFLLGFWQLLSAILNSNTFMLHGLQQEIIRYWKLTGSIIAILFLSSLLSIFLNPDDVQVLAAVAVAASIPVALYYLNIYKRLIKNIAMRKEIGGVIKSKH